MTALYEPCALQYLLGSVPVEIFFERYWDRAPLLVRGDETKLASVYDIAGWQRRRGFRDARAAARDAGGAQVSTAIAPAQVSAMFAAGMTISADVSEDPVVAPFLLALSRHLPVAGGRAFANLYASGDGSGFALHWDQFHVFVLQIAGRKRWYYSPSPALPSALCGGHVGPDGRAVYTVPRDGESAVGDDGALVAVPRDADLETILLCPGDCLYLPPGTWHRTQAIDESIALSVSPPRAPAFEVILGALRSALLQRREWRSDLVAVPGRCVAHKIDALLSELSAHVASADARAIDRAWRVAVELQREGPGPGGPGPVRVTRSDVLAPAGGAPIRMVVAPSDTGVEQVFLVHRGIELALPVEAAAFARGLARGQPFRADRTLTWDPSLSWSDAATTLSELVSAGVLELR